MYPADGADCPRIRCDVTETRTWAAPSSRATRPERCNTGEGPTSTAGPSPAMRPYRPVPNRAIGSMSSCSSSAGCGTSASVSRSTAERSTVVAVLADDPGPQRLVDPLDDAVDGVMLLQPVEHRAQLRFGAPQTGDGVQVLPFVVRGRQPAVRGAAGAQAPSVAGARRSSAGADGMPKTASALHPGVPMPCSMTCCPMPRRRRSARRGIEREVRQGCRARRRTEAEVRGRDRPSAGGRRASGHSPTARAVIRFPAPEPRAAHRVRTARRPRRVPRRRRANRRTGIGRTPVQGLRRESAGGVRHRRE